MAGDTIQSGRSGVAVAEADRLEAKPATEYERRSRSAPVVGGCGEHLPNLLADGPVDCNGADSPGR